MDTRHETETTSTTLSDAPCEILVSRAAVGGAKTPKEERSRLAFTAFAFAIHAGALAVMAFVPPDPWGLAAEELLATDDRLVAYDLVALEMIEQEIDVAEAQDSSDAAGGQGQRHFGEEGQMGRQDAPRSDNRYAIKGPPNNPDPHMARDMAREAATQGILTVMSSNAPTSPFGEEVASGLDPENAVGLLMGSAIGDAFGYGGIAVRGTGRGGGGDGQGTIGLGTWGRIGHGGGPGNGQLRSRRSGQGPTVAISTGTNVRGSLSSDTIRRYIRRNINSIRSCYEQELVRQPDLQGRVAVRFVISGQGAVASSTVDSSTLGNPSAEQCVAHAVQRIGFPQSDDGGVVIVTYPFLFTSVD